MLSLKSTSIGYNKPLIKNISATASEGELILIVGNNGVGKSTLFNTILKQNTRLDGDIEINSISIDNLGMQDISRQISMVFSKANIPAQYTVKDLIAFGKFIHYPYYFRLTIEDGKEVEKIISQLQLETYQDHYLQQLSDGNLQKAFIGRALAQNTALIILDEPTAHLDEANKIMILQLLRHLTHQMRKTIIFSSHDWRLAKEFSDKIWYIKDQTLYEGITEDILTQHTELSQASLFSINENFVAPYIIAPQLQKELLFSFLQKNTKKDLQNFTFTYSDEFWKISKGGFYRKALNFSEILQILKNHL